jgi:hypothetical protein
MMRRHIPNLLVDKHTVPIALMFRSFTIGVCIGGSARYFLLVPVDPNLTIGLGDKWVMKNFRSKSP